MFFSGKEKLLFCINLVCTNQLVASSIMTKRYYFLLSMSEYLEILIFKR